MDIRTLTDGYAVSPQIAPQDAQAIKAAGFTTVICNRPDGEIPADLQSTVVAEALAAEGLKLVINPVVGGAITMDNVTAQADAIAQADGAVLAYCASGNRSSIVWALANAGKRPTDELIAVPAQYGYALEQFRPLIDQLANR